MTGISDKTFREIVAKRIEPAPRWKFALHHAAIWSFLVLAVAAGSLAVSAGVCLVLDYEWDLSAYPEGSAWSVMWRGVPYFWLAALAILLIVALVEYRRTRLGYRSYASVIVAVCLLVSLGAGAALHSVGVGELIDEAASRRVPFYEDVVWHKDDLWSLPDVGLLAGTVTSVDSSAEDVVVTDFAGDEWHVDAAAALPPGETLERGEQVKITGERKDGDGFHAKKIHAWDGKNRKDNRDGDKSDGGRKDR